MTAAPPTPAASGMDPLDYPGRAVAEPTVVTAAGDRFLRAAPGGDDLCGRLDAVLNGEGQPSVAVRSRVLAIGSNADADVVRHKLSRAGVSPTIPIVPAAVAGIAVGHSAHVSARGYIAAAPYRREDSATACALLLPTAEQLAALDATEPNYRRTSVDPQRLRGGAGDVVPDSPLWIYASRWGVLAGSDGPLPLQGQTRLHRWLVRADGGFADLVAGMAPAQVVDLLRRPTVRAELRRRWATRLARDAGLY